MKTCPNCRYVWPDEYAGQCLECGRPLGSTVASNGGDLGFAFAKQIQSAQKEDQMEARLRSARSPRAQLEAYDSFDVRDEVVEAARKMVVQREEVVYEDS